MKAVFFVLQNADLLSPLLRELQKYNIKGGTIFDSNGMGRELAKSDDVQFVGFLRSMLSPTLKSTKTLLFILEESRIDDLAQAIDNVVGSLDNPNTGILFSIPVDYVKGLKL